MLTAANFVYALIFYVRSGFDLLVIIIERRLQKRRTTK